MKYEKRGSIELTGVHAADLIIFIILLVVFIGLFTQCSNETDLTQDKFFEFVNATKEISLMSPGSTDTINIILADESAIIAMNPGKDFYYEVKGELSAPNAFVAKRPAPCPENLPCMCLCQQVQYKALSDDLQEKYSSRDGGPYINPQSKSELECLNPICRTFDSEFKFKQKSIMEDVFDEPEKSVRYGDRTNFYWDNSFILLKSSNMCPTCTKNYKGKSYAWDVSGYMYEDILNDFDVTLIKDKNGEVGICFKDLCEVTMT